VAAELEAWKLRDPIERVKAYLLRSGAADAGFIDQVDAEADELGAWLRTACRAMPDPAPLSMFEHVYAGPQSILDAEREGFAAYLDSFADGPPEPDAAEPKPVQPAVAQAFARGGEEL
jgi:pyruvate dehydrogenase E1 component alpha subunit